jgi:hypothetical protein
MWTGEANSKGRQKILGWVALLGFLWLLGYAQSWIERDREILEAEQKVLEDQAKQCEHDKAVGVSFSLDCEELEARRRRQQ